MSAIQCITIFGQSSPYWLPIYYAYTGIDDLQCVLEELVDVEKKWLRLGLALGLRQPTLKNIKDENDDIDDCKMEMLTQWLKKMENSDPSWRSLVDALRNPTVKHKEIAEVIERKHL